MDRIEGIPEGYRLGEATYVDRTHVHPTSITFELIPIEQPKQPEAAVDSELIDFLAKQYTVDEEGDAVWNFCFSKNHGSFRSALRSWMREAEHVTIREREKGTK